MVKDDIKNIELLVNKKLLREGKVFIHRTIDDKAACDFIKKMMFLNLKDKDRVIEVFINTPGGSITSGLAIYDTIRTVSNPVKVIVTGIAASMGSIILCAADKGMRYMYPNSQVLIHQPLIMGKVIAPSTDVNIQADEMEYVRNKLNSILTKATGQPRSSIESDTDRDKYFSAEEALKYGLVDYIYRGDFLTT